MVARPEPQPEAGWEHFPHMADVGVRGFGPTPAAAFEQAAVAMTAAIVDPAEVAARETVTIECTAHDMEMLLVEWLNAVIYEMATRRMLFGRFAVRIDGGTLAGQAMGERVDRGRHQPATEIKGATYTALKVAQERGGRWMAQCVVDV